MTSSSPSQLFQYRNRHEVDSLWLNACDSDGNFRKPRIPAELLYAPFQEFLNNLGRGPCSSVANDPRGDVPHSFFENIMDLLACAATRYESEDLYSQRLNDMFRSILGPNFTSHITPRQTTGFGKTDGSYQATGISGSLMVVIREDKLGSGSGGGDSLVELFGHYCNLVTYGGPRKSSIEPPAPCVLLEVVGPRLTLSLAACSNLATPCISHAVVSHSLVVQASPEAQVASLAGFFLSLRHLIVTMTEQMNSLPPPLLSDDMRLGENLVFQTSSGDYHKYIRDGVKYGTQVHDWCVQNNLAPVFSQVRICPGWTRIEMKRNNVDYILASFANGEQTRQRILKSVREAIGILHCNNMVHGDVRASNTLYSLFEGKMTVHLIDFDASGLIGSATYGILRFNPAVPFHEQAVPGGPIEAAHDLFRLESIERFFV